MRHLNSIFCVFELNTVEKGDIFKGGFSKRLEAKAIFTLKPSCLEVKKKEKRKMIERWEDECRQLSIAANANRN